MRKKNREIREPVQGIQTIRSFKKKKKWTEKRQKTYKVIQENSGNWRTGFVTLQGFNEFPSQMKAHPHQDTIFRYFRKVETSGRFYKRPVKMGNGPPKKDQCYSATRKKEILPLVITWITCGSWRHHAAAAAKSLQLCPTLCDPRDGSPPGSVVPGILQARTLGGLLFPSPMHESEKWKWSRSVVSNS